MSALSALCALHMPLGQPSAGSSGELPWSGFSAQLSGFSGQKVDDNTSREMAGASDEDALAEAAALAAKPHVVCQALPACLA